jgi:hypothetical protein
MVLFYVTNVKSLRFHKERADKNYKLFLRKNKKAA